MTELTFNIFGTEKFWGKRFRIVSITAYAGLLTVENEAGYRFTCSAAPEDLYGALALLDDAVLQVSDGVLSIVSSSTGVLGDDKPHSETAHEHTPHEEHSPDTGETELV